MKRFLILLVLLGVIAAVAYGVLNRTDDSAGTAPLLAGAPATAAVRARGEYLTKAADCIACHTVAGSGRPFAGGVGFKLPFGTIFSSNITADSTSGIGTWSDADFVRAVREGIRKDGRHLYPAFPYTSYTRLSRDDALAIKAYLFSLPAIKQTNRANILGFPFDQRWAMGFWNAAFFKSGRFKADPAKSSEWNSGAYLATALGHCGECHTPRNVGFGLKQGEEFAGEELQGWRAYNITAHPRYGIGSWSDAEIEQYLKTGHAEGRASASGPMGEAVAHSLQFLDPADARALVGYLRSVPPRTGKEPIEVNPTPAAAMASTAAAPPAGAGAADGPLPAPGSAGYAAAREGSAPASGTAAAAGLRLFEAACASCHQWNGKGRQSSYAALLGTRSVNDAGGKNVIQAILQGVKLRIAGGDVYMPAFGSGYSDTEVAALANYVVAQFGGKRGTVTPDEVAKRRAL